MASLLQQGATGPAASWQSERQQLLVSAVYCVCMFINGGVVGAFGPSLEAFQRATGLSVGHLGTAVLQNRFTKLGGTLLWAWYAGRISDPRARSPCIRPHAAMAIGLSIMAASCVVLGLTRSGWMLHVVMAASGAAYGFTDSGCIMLSVWLWQGNARRQRGCVALTNFFFTFGALVTPVLVAASLHHRDQAIWPAFHALAFTAIGTALLFSLLPSPLAEGERAPVSGISMVDLEGCATDAEQGAAALAGGGQVGRDGMGGDAATQGQVGHEVAGEFTAGDGLLDAAAAPCDAQGGTGPSCAELQLSVGVLEVPRTSPAHSKEDPVRLSEADGGAEPVPAAATADDASGSGLRAGLVVLSAGVVAFFSNGCEHAAATWLSAYGVRQCGMQVGLGR